MPSTARATFEANRQDVDRLMQLHTTEGGDEPGRRVGLEVLNKSAIVLLCAIWEAYVEDLATEVIDHYVTHVGEVSKLPKRLREQVHKELTDQSSTASWKLAGDGWRAHLRNRLKAFEAQRNTGLNTPKASYVQHFFATAVGVTDVPAHWSWSGMAADKAQAKLDRLVTLRGDIAHRGSTSAGGVRKGTVTTYAASFDASLRLPTATCAVRSTELPAFPCSREAVRKVGPLTARLGHPPPQERACDDPLFRYD